VRDGALVTLKLKHISVDDQSVNQDPREVRTKNSKHIRTTFYQVPGSARQIVENWVNELRSHHLWGNDDPLFPATLMGRNSERGFQPVGIARKHWANADAARKIFAEAFQLVGLPAFNPHSFRHALVLLGENRCATPEEFKAWSMNLGHESVATNYPAGSMVWQTETAVVTAQALDYESGGQEFESLRARHFRTKLGTPAGTAPPPITSRSRTVLRPMMRISVSSTSTWSITERM
jgi:integrase